MKPLAALLVAALGSVPTGALAQSEILVDADPPLTRTMVRDFQRFVQWFLETPLTGVQEDRLRDYVLKSWSEDNRQEIARVRNLLALRNEMEKLGLHTQDGAAAIVRRNALVNWRQRRGENFAPWGLQIFDHATKPIVEGPPPLTRQASETYAELAWHVYREASRLPSPTMEAETRARVVESVAAVYASLTGAEKAALGKTPVIASLVRHGWGAMAEGDQESLRRQWAADLKAKNVGGPSSRAFLQWTLANLDAIAKPYGGFEAYGTGW